MKVVLTNRARRRVLVVGRWWRNHRPDAADLFERELEEVIEKLTSGPTFGLVHGIVRGHTIRRMRLPTSEQHVYYSVNPTTDTVVIHTLWGPRRGRTPKL